MYNKHIITHLVVVLKDKLFACSNYKDAANQEHIFSASRTQFDRVFKCMQKAAWSQSDAVKTRFEVRPECGNIAVECSNIAKQYCNCL
jgi:hypothetical protein